MVFASQHFVSAIGITYKMHKRALEIFEVLKKCWYKVKTSVKASVCLFTDASLCNFNVLFGSRLI